MLAWTVYISFLGVLVLMLLPKGQHGGRRERSAKLTLKLKTTITYP